MIGAVLLIVLMICLVGMDVGFALAGRELVPCNLDNRMTKLETNMKPLKEDLEALKTEQKAMRREMRVEFERMRILIREDQR